MSDPYWSNVSALLHFDGSNGSTTFTDEKGKTWTANGNAQISIAQSKFGGASAVLDGSGDYVSTPDHADFEFGSGDFTVECWIRPADVPTSANYRTIIAKDDVSTTRGWILLLDGDQGGKINFSYRDGTTTYSVLSTAAPSASSWIHVAVSRNTTNLRLFVDGTLQNTTSAGTSTVNETSHPVQIGSLKNGAGQVTTAYYNGYIDDLRITKGVGRYTSGFTPPTAAFEHGPETTTVSLSAAIQAARTATASVSGAIKTSRSATTSIDARVIDTYRTVTLSGAIRVARTASFGVNAVIGYVARIALPSPLHAAPFRTVVLHDFTRAITATTYRYVCDLKTPSGIVRVPISSWQSSLQTDGSSYLQVVIPAATVFVDPITAATRFVVRRVASDAAGASLYEAMMARSPAETVRYDQGPYRHTCTLSGYVADAYAAETNPHPAYNRTLTGIRLRSSTADKRRVRCDIDWIARPGKRVFVGSEEMLVSWINHYVTSSGDEYMDVGGA